MSKEELRKLLPMEFYAKDDLKLYAEISLETLNKIMDYITDKEQRIDKAIKYIKSYCAEPDGSIVTYGDDLCPIELLEILEGINEED